MRKCGKCGTARQVTDDDIIRHMRFACWMPKTADTRLEYVILNCVSMTTMVSRTRLGVTFTRTLSVILIIVYVINEIRRSRLLVFPIMVSVLC